jgi:hypothetical protein
LDVFKSAHTPAQSVVPAVHAQLLFTQISAPVQICPQNPQLALSLVRLTHELPQRASPAPHAGEHTPALHTVPPRHRLPHIPHIPQLAPFDWRSAQTAPPPPPPPPPPMHAVWPAGHMQEPPMQGAPAGHAFPQAPQFPFDVCRSTQVMPPPPPPKPPPPAQSVRPVEQPMTHVPAVHIVPAGQRLPHPPQFRGSICVFVQVTPQRV